MDGSNEMDAGVLLISDMSDEIDNLRGVLTAARAVFKRMDFADESIALEGIDAALKETSE